MLSYLGKILIQELVGAFIKFASDYFKWNQKKKENRETAKEVVSEKDPQTRAQRMRDFLNS